MQQVEEPLLTLQIGVVTKQRLQFTCQGLNLVIVLAKPKRVINSREEDVLGFGSNYAIIIQAFVGGGVERERGH